MNVICPHLAVTRISPYVAMTSTHIQQICQCSSSYLHTVLHLPFICSTCSTHSWCFFSMQDHMLLPDDPLISSCLTMLRLPSPPLCSSYSSSSSVIYHVSPCPSCAAPASSGLIKWPGTHAHTCTHTHTHKLKNQWQYTQS